MYLILIINRVLQKLVERWLGKVTTQISYTVVLLYEIIHCNYLCKLIINFEGSINGFYSAIL